MSECLCVQLTGSLNDFNHDSCQHTRIITYKIEDYSAIIVHQGRKDSSGLCQVCEWLLAD